MMEIILCIFAVLLIIILVYDSKLAKARAAGERLQSDVRSAMRERLRIDNEIMRAMKALMQEGSRHSGAERQHAAKRGR